MRRCSWVVVLGMSLVSAPLGASSERDATLLLGGKRVDLRALPSVQGRAGDALAMLQFSSSVKQSDLDELNRAGLTALQYVHPDSYVVYGSAAALQQAAQRSAVRAVADFSPEFKTVLLEDRTAGSYRATLVRQAALADEVLQSFGAIVLERRILDAYFEQVRFAADATTLGRLAELAGVYVLESIPVDGGTRNELSNQLYAHNVAASGSPPAPQPGYLAWLAQRGFNGAGVRIANVDSGIDENHPDLINRMRTCSPPLNTTCGGTASSHGTHTAGIMAADGSSGVNNAQGFRRGLGVAPGAEMIEQRYSPFFGQAGGMLLLMRESQANGALLSGNSWGPAGSPRGYDQDTRQVDVGTRDVNPDVAGDQVLTYVLSMMNGNGGVSSQGTPDEAKNVITVGSHRVNSGSTLLEWRNISANSGHGPALDGRRIPHLIAPGCSVDSSVPGASYSLLCGTSMASPHVSGGVAVFAQAYRQRFSQFPSPAMSKAAMLVHTENMVGRLDADDVVLGNRPDNKQGFGRARFDRVLDTFASSMFVDQDTVFENSGESWSVTFMAANPAEPVQIMMAFTDAPGAGLGGATPAWVNDLDLTVSAQGSSYRGNVFGADGLSATGGAADNRNNVELVSLSPTMSGSSPFTIEVRATAINGDALPNAGDQTQQDFALICVNCRAATASPAGVLFASGFEF